MGHEEFNWFFLIPFLKEQPIHVITSAFVVILIFVLCIRGYKRLKDPNENLVPEEKFSLKNVLEISVEALLSLIESMMGKEGRRFVPLIGPLFIYIFVSNILGVIPGFSPPTDNINTNAACAVIVFLAYNYYGIREHGIGYVKHFTGPVWWLAFLMVPIEFLTHLFRPFSLTLRLFGNILGDHTVLRIFSDLVPLIVPIAFICLGIFVAFIQALIFSALSMMYISGAVSHEH